MRDGLGAMQVKQPAHETDWTVLDHLSVNHQTLVLLTLLALVIAGRSSRDLLFEIFP